MRFNSYDELIQWARVNAGKMVQVKREELSLSTGRVVGYDGNKVIIEDPKERTITENFFVLLVNDAKHGVMYDYLHEFFLIEGESSAVDSRFPHKCTTCRSPAYIGAYSFECSNSNCKMLAKG